MIDVVKQRVESGKTNAEKVNILRETLQIFCLKIMYDKNMFDFTAFVGGTALRILYNIRRYSEDLDFSLINNANINIESIKDNLVDGYRSYGLRIDKKIKSVGAVKSIYLKFPGLLYDCALSPLKDQNIMIKWDIDTDPPSGAENAKKIIDDMFMFSIVHYDLPSLFAGKLHACFFRSYLKGRDWYDLIWYLNKRVKPNVAFLNNAIMQTEGRASDITDDNFKEFLVEKVTSMDLSKAADDVKVFLENPKEAELITKQNIVSLIEDM